MKRIILECLIVLLLGGVFGMVANQISPRGLKLSRNYFPPGNTSALSRASKIQEEAVPGPYGETNGIAQKLSAKGLQAVDTQQAVALFNSTGFQQNTIVFVDARDDTHFQAGHIPGAYQLYYYQPEGYLPEVLPALQIAEKVIVYCNGGNCEDSEFTALLLQGTGIPTTSLFVYTGGFDEWAASGNPVETGARLSGVIRQR